MNIPIWIFIFCTEQAQIYSVPLCCRRSFRFLAITDTIFCRKTAGDKSLLQQQDTARRQYGSDRLMEVMCEKSPPSSPLLSGIWFFPKKSLFKPFVISREMRGLRAAPEAGVLDEPYSAKSAQQSSHTGPSGYIGLDTAVSAYVDWRACTLIKKKI